MEQEEISFLSVRDILHRSMMRNERFIFERYIVRSIEIRYGISYLDGQLLPGSRTVLCLGSMVWVI